MQFTEIIDIYRPPSCIALENNLRDVGNFVPIVRENYNREGQRGSTHRENLNTREGQTDSKHEDKYLFTWTAKGVRS